MPLNEWNWFDDGDKSVVFINLISLALIFDWKQNFYYSRFLNGYGNLIGSL